MTTSAEDSCVLVVVVPDPRDLAYALEDGWYRIPLARAPARIAVDYLAFYQTGAFPEDERCLVRWYAPVQDYRIVQRRELLPDEPDHPRAADRYYRVGLGPGVTLPCPIPSRRLRRITFIPTTLSRLLAAREINDLWLKTGSHERMWQALQQAGLDAEYQFEVAESPTPYTADFVLLCRKGNIAIVIETGDNIAFLLHENHAFYTGAPRIEVDMLSHTELLRFREENMTNFISQLLTMVEERGGMA